MLKYMPNCKVKLSLLLPLLLLPPAPPPAGGNLV
jgi:hypothetical protein